MSIPTDQERLGTTIGDGKYTLERILGRGGMGTVFEALHTWTGRHVAVKLLLNEMALDVGASQRFLQEARSATAVEHPNVVEVLDMGRHNESTVYMVFELLRGESLADRLETNGPLDALQAAMILLPVADALAAAHRLGIVHRDVKPDNIFLEDDGMGYVRPKLLDFGIACLSERKSSMTRTRIIMGTPGYLSPEHAQGFHAGPASDVWSLGVVLFECITGYCPFESESLAGAMLAIVSNPVPSLRECSNVPEPIADLVERTLVRDPAARFPDCAAFRDALAAAAQVEVVPSCSRSVSPRIVRDGDELFLSSAYGVEVRQAGPNPVPATVVRRIDSVHLATLDAVPPINVGSRGGARPAVPTSAELSADDDLDALETSALLAALLPERSPWRRAAMFALPALLLLLVHMVATTYRPTRPEGSRATGGVTTAAAAGSGARAPGPTVREDAPDTSAPPSDVGSPAAALSARSTEWSPAPPLPAATGRVVATESRAQAGDELGSGWMRASSAPADTVPRTVRPVPRTSRSRAGERPAIRRGANESLILD